MIPKIVRPGLSLLLLAVLSGCNTVVMNPAGDIAKQQADLITVSVLLMLIIIIPVMILTVVFAWKYRKGANARYEPDWDHSTKLELVIWGAPLLIIIALGLITWISTHKLDPYRPLDRIDANRPITAEHKVLEVQVVSLDWKWLFIYPGAGYGGSCFPKDVQALDYLAKQSGTDAQILPAVHATNEQQKRKLPEHVIRRFGPDLRGRTIGVWGLSFKPNTDDMREAPSRVLVEAIWAAGGRVKAFDPQAMTACEQLYGQRDDMTYCDSKEDAIDDADCLVICTEWKAFWAPDFEDIKRRLASPVIIDGRNLYNPALMEELDIEYYGIGRGQSVSDYSV